MTVVRGTVVPTPVPQPAALELGAATGTLLPAEAPPPTSGGPGAQVQRSFDDLGTPLREVTFCVIDLETTGGSPVGDAITEVGAVLLRGGACVGTFQTLVNPKRGVPPAITVLTGITEAMVLPAPPIEAVLPSLLEFMGGAVIVGHNVRFDVAFLDAALTATGRERLAHHRVDTCALARRLVRDEVRNCKLSTLAQHFRLSHEPCHRALDDALATGELLHCLLERVGSIGVTGLEELIALPKLAAHPQAAKLRLTTSLPRAPGVYLFRDRAGLPLYVGTATDLRARVRSYFSSDDRRKVGPMLRDTQQIDHHVCANTLEAAVTEIRWIHALRPRYNRRSRDPERYRYVRLSTSEPFPRLSVVRIADATKGLHLGPLPSTRVARQVIDAIHSVVPLRRCTLRARTEPVRESPCSAAQLGATLCPCADPAASAAAYEAAVEQVRLGLTTDPSTLLDPLRNRMARLASEQRFEEASDARDRAAALAGALRRQQRLTVLRASGELAVELPGHGGAILVDGVVQQSWDRSGQVRALGVPSVGTAADSSSAHPPSTTDRPLALDADEVGRDQVHVPVHLADELLAVATWLDRHAARLELLGCSGGLHCTLPAIDSFRPTSPSATRQVR